KPPAAKGIIEVGAMAAAIAALERAVADDEAARAQGDDKNAGSDTEAEPSRGDGVSLRQRAWPLVEMMKRSVAEDADIVWGV
ncbi:MAG: DUF1840 family protein, partial [Burkholderiaceae bacterium]